jgi:hypothetical protein
MAATDAAYGWIQKGRYRYKAGLPNGCLGEIYEVVEPRVLDVPQYQVKVLVKALTGPDKDTIPFTVTLANFAQRYEPIGGE